MDLKTRKQVFLVTGMTCGHCKSAVELAIRGIDGVTVAQVDLKAGKAIVEGQFADQSVVASVEEAGYEAKVSGGE
jgi:copper chaperone